MTTIDLARRATACKGWRWLAGMRLRSIRVYLRVVGLNGDGALRLSWDDPGRPVEGDTYTVEEMGGALPDLTDPCTLGGLLALVREAHNQPLAFCRYVEADPSYWHINTGHVGETEAAALVAALEAAP